MSIKDLERTLEEKKQRRHERTIKDHTDKAQKNIRQSTDKMNDAAHEAAENSAKLSGTLKTLSRILEKPVHLSDEGRELLEKTGELLSNIRTVSLSDEDREYLKTKEVEVSNFPTFPTSFEVTNQPKYPTKLKAEITNLPEPEGFPAAIFQGISDKLGKPLMVDFVERGDPKNPLSVRLSDGEEFYEAIGGAITAMGGGGSVSPFSTQATPNVRQPALIDADRHLQVDIVSGAIIADIEGDYVDDSAFVAGTDKGLMVGGFVTSDTVDSGDFGAFAMNTAREQIIQAKQSGTWNIGTLTTITNSVDVNLQAGDGTDITETGGALDVNIASGSVVADIEGDYVDDSEFTVESDKGLAVGGVFTTDEIDSGDFGAFKMNAKRELAITKSMAGSVVNSGNSTTTPLGGGGVFTGTGADLLGYSAVCVTLYADVDSAADGMTFQFSTDDSNWDDVYIFEMDVSESDTRRFQFPVTARYFRVVYTNGAGAQSAFRVQTILHTENQLTTIHRVKDDVADDRSAQLVKSVIIAQQAGGGDDFIAIQATNGGNLKVSVEEFDSSVFGQDTMANSLPVTMASDQSDINVSQATHDSLNANVNLQIGDADVTDTNPVPVAAEKVSSANTSGKASVGSSDTSVLASYASRIKAVFVNDSDETIYLNLSATAVMNEGIRLNARGGNHTEEQYTGEVSAICASGGKNLTITEL